MGGLDRGKYYLYIALKALKDTETRQPVCDFILVINSNMSHIFYRFGDTVAKTPEITVSPTTCMHKDPLRLIRITFDHEKT